MLARRVNYTFGKKNHMTPSSSEALNRPHNCQISLTRFLSAIIFLFMLVTFCSTISNVHAQTFEGLNKLSGFNTETYYSLGTEEKAERMAKQLDGVTAFFEKHLHFAPSVTLLILSPKDWSTHTKFPFYGMPHYTSAKTLVVASEDNEYWKSMLPARGMLGASASMFAKTYSDGKGGLTMEPFFDLLAIHELGHAYHIQGGLVMQRRWMGELFCNILLHTYIAEKEPQLLEPLTFFPKMVITATDTSALKYTTLQDFETHYNELGPNYPQNYGWYQCKLHVGAGKIYDSSRLKGIKNLWTTLKTQKDILNDTLFAKLLAEKVHQSLADIQSDWDQIK